MRKETPCDYCDCPYNVTTACGCDYRCGEVEEYFPEVTQEDLDEYNADPYEGANELYAELKKEPCSQCGGTEFKSVYVNSTFSRFDSTCMACGYVRYSIPD